MRTLVFNCGSSSIKYALFDGDAPAPLAAGQQERLDSSDPAAYSAAVERIVSEVGAGRVDAAAHRVVHGGIHFTSPVLVDDAVEAELDALSGLAPLHNPAGVAGIRSARAALPGLPQVAVFDTAFHSGLPDHAYTYAIDGALAEREGIRRFGFHGISYRYVSVEAARLVGRDAGELRMIVLHLGNGASAAAIDRGRSIDTSMGYTPLEGLVMGTRSGDLDPSILLLLQRRGLSVDQVDDLLNRRSGLLGLSGSSDMRDVVEAAESGDARAVLALEVYLHRLRHYIGAYAAELGGVDLLVFTGGVGENSAGVRRRAVERLGFLGLAIDPVRDDRSHSGARVISPEGAAVAVLVVPTNEERQIAREAELLLG